jgi:thiamine pyrophosphate-dependent acetolactate synthase large subunit-like protein
MSARRKPSLDRRAVVAAILKGRTNELVVAGLGAPCFDVMACGDTPLNFYTWGGMGGTAMIGLGLALAQPKRRVLVITGDGDMLMAMGSFATIGAKQPKNLAIVVMDNEHYGETGMQQTHTQLGTEFAGVAKATGFRAAGTIYTEAQLKAWLPRILRERGPVFAGVKVAVNRGEFILPPRDGTELKLRFQQALRATRGNARR